LELVWRPIEKEIGVSDKDYNVDGCFKVFSHPWQVLTQLILVERYLHHPTMLDLYKVVLESFGHNREAEVLKLYKHLYKLGHESILRNSGRYLSGIHAFAGLADPDFAPVVFEAFAHWLKKDKAPSVRTELGKRLEMALKNAKLHYLVQNEMDKLVGDDCWPFVVNLIEVLSESQTKFVKLITKPSGGNYVIRLLNLWRSCLSHTQPVEKTFLDWDNQS
jgi:hypothetical protein